MKKTTNIFILGLITILISSCNSIQPVLVLTPADFIGFYLFIGLVSFLMAIYMTNLVNGKDGFGTAFWLWFIVGMICIVIPIVAAIIKYKTKK